MKKILPVLCVVCLALILLGSCKKDFHPKDEENKIVAIDATVAAGSVYLLDLSPYADADDIANIKTQAEHFDISVINNAGAGKFNYQYKVAAQPKAGFNGTDKVVLQIQEPAGRCHKSATTITVNITIL